MNHRQILLTFLGVVFTIMPMLSQDTIVVETFQWSSESRDSVFFFPDDPDQTYHKIIMEYGMRCHDLEVGNGDVGCREWDYSCNTVVYDSSRTDSVLVDDGSGSYVYEVNSPVRYEIMSFVTPYGNGLDLGPEGKTWTFDVSDYAPILKGRKRIALIGGGQNQEEMRITFKFITGTPEREVIDIRPVWPLEFGVSGDAINNDIRFEPRQVAVPQEAEHVKIKSVITGHGQTGEFTPFRHRVFINGDMRRAYRVWKECSDVPVYPQGGTWILDRAGWCPGDPSQVNEYELEPDDYENDQFEIDYSVQDIVQSPDLRYIVNHQAVYYGPYNFDRDLQVHDVIRPSDKVEHARYNPACYQPQVVIRNGGKEDLTAATLEYGIKGAKMEQVNWSGQLSTGETDTITLSYPDEDFISTAAKAIFEVRIVESDDYNENNVMNVRYSRADHYNGELVMFLLTTNRAPSDNRFTLKDAEGNTLVEYDDLVASRSYFDEVTLPQGCYQMLLTDSRDDGLYYWAYEQNGSNIGRGGLELFVDETVVKEFEPEFGRFVQYDFSVGGATSTRDREFSRLRVFPNPTHDRIRIETEGKTGGAEIQIYTMTGQLVKGVSVLDKLMDLDISQLPSGPYILVLERGSRQHRTIMIKE